MSSLPELPELVRWIARRVKVLELGSGGGANALCLAEQGYHATVIEPSLPRARQLRREAEARAVSLRVVQQEFRNVRLTGKYDIVVAQLSVPEVAIAELEELVRRIQARTRRGGFNLVALTVGPEAAELASRSECGTPDQAICALYDGWRLLGRRSYLSADESAGRLDVIRLIAQRRA